MKSHIKYKILGVTVIFKILILVCISCSDRGTVCSKPIVENQVNVQFLIPQFLTNHSKSILTGLLLYLFVQSIRNLKRQEEKIRALHLNIDSIAHELNTPLTTLKFAIKNSAFLNEDNVIGRQLQRIEQTVAKIHHKDTKDNILLKKEHLLSIIQGLKERFPSLRIEENIDFQQNTILCIEDFEQIAENLTENAFKYGSSKLKIKCVFREEIQMEWEDNGIGIPEKERDKIFKKYYRIDRAINQSVNGLGVGLYIIHQIIHHYQGTIELAQGRSNGTLFTIFISDK